LAEVRLEHPVFVHIHTTKNIMSHFSDIRTQLVHSQALLKALEALGFVVESVEIQPAMKQQELEAIALHYRNSFRDSSKAHVVARHEQLLNQTTAIGFLWNAEAKAYDLQCDPYELRYSELGKTWGYYGSRDAEIQQFLSHRIQMEHDHAYVRLQYPPDQFIITENKIDNGIQLTIKPKTQFVNIGSAI
jgi:hypothetical protein